jgi:hypothetical protein
MGTDCLAFTIDLTSMQRGTSVLSNLGAGLRVSKAFNTDPLRSNSDILVYMFPFGTDDIVYTVYLDGGK